MDQQEAIQAFLAQYKSREVLGILKHFLRTPEGRNKIAVSLIHPVKLNIDYLTGTKKALADIDYPMGSRVQEYQLFLATIPEEEQKAPPFPELADLITQLEKLIKERRLVDLP